MIRPSCSRGDAGTQRRHMNSRKDAKHAPFDCRSGQALSAAERGRKACRVRTTHRLVSMEPQTTRKPTTSHRLPATEHRQPICLTRRHGATENQDGEMHRPLFPTVRHIPRGATCERHIARSALTGRRSGAYKPKCVAKSQPQPEPATGC